MQTLIAGVDIVDGLIHCKSRFRYGALPKLWQDIFGVLAATKDVDAMVKFTILKSWCIGVLLSRLPLK